MATLSGTYYSSYLAQSDAYYPLQHIVILFNVSGTYAQADNAQLENVNTLIEDARKNGKTVTLRNVMLWRSAQKASAPGILMGLKTVAISTNNITFEITEAAAEWTMDLTTELANGAVPEQVTPFAICVGFTES